MSEAMDIRSLVQNDNRFIANQQGQPVAVLLTIPEYEHYLDLLDDEADSQDADLATRLARAAQASGPERLSFQAYLNERAANV